MAPCRVWGPNVFAANGDDWKRHRRIIAPAFCPATYAAVWEETSRVFDEMEAEEGWLERSTVDIPAINSYTYKFALILISACGFGNPLSWTARESSPGRMSFATALEIISKHHIARILLPQWAYNLPIKWIRDLSTAVDAMNQFMRDMINERRRDLTSGHVNHKDILTLMIKSNEGEDKFMMDDSELIGNTFILLLAGHDTTSKTLNAATGFLGLYEDFQEEVYREIMKVMPTDADVTFENSARLTKVRSCFLEASRLFPAVQMMIRDTTEDVVLSNVGPNNDGLLPLKRDTRVVVDLVGLHYNPHLFPDPEAFKPERWYDAHDNDLITFSFGSRSCIGRKFAIAEGVCFLSKLLRHWKVRIITKEGETREEWRRRVMRGYMDMNLGVRDVPIRLFMLNYSSYHSVLDGKSL
ncbi:uncharacterized protein PHACADRAFT_214578 [Phanerochaete carnosa HHB-10118-sp]|uniref:Cytochrome P450 n=1 Tax=Phanerochaete carnosa (strain HHB-10118-sp) TaxID=650164 RepID=K5UHG9_PHACS|nr:uncharacterized protein PHACADRAFT_214578 [Phanerochaete carnosa HHB-10118-sp]EKM48946.1 hypothetical protein PHACADRAFT_214578 [Phanerochaete carnosa HHB-10118-sp]